MSTDNIIRGPFTGDPYKELGALQEELWAVLMARAGTIPLSGAIGVLRIIEHTLLVNQVQARIDR